MITGKTKTEANYRALMLDSSSSLKDFLMDRKKYYKKYILNQNVEEKENQAANMGRIVETLLMEPEEIDNRFYMSACASPPTATMLDFVEALYKHTSDCLDELGKVTKPMSVLLEDAYKDSGFKIKFETVVSKFVGSDAEIYYNEILKVRINNLTVVSSQDLAHGEKIVEVLKTNRTTSAIVNLVNSVNYSVLNQFQIENYEVDGHPFKSMLDKVIVCHKTKSIQIYDLKCTWSVENFYEEYYLYRRAYIQAYLYKKAVEHLTKLEDNEWFGYLVENPQFIVCDSSNYYNPLIYTLTDDDMKEAYNGFDYKGKTYKGVKNLIADLKWALDNDIWNISRTNYQQNGIINIKHKG